MPLELGAEPYSNFNEKITAECYGPNAQVGNFERISFNLGGTLAAWLARYAPDTYQRIVAADRVNLVMSGLGNALAQSVHHTILPLANERDKRTQVRWGIASFRYRFGHDPLGMWLPEMAVDLATLQVLVDHGIKYTILSPEQLRTPVRGAGPYRIRLDTRRSIAVFVRDAPLSNSLSFDMGRYANASAWVRERLLG
ncbi:MAG: glycoside hydrolase, partial [Chloroflexota bacterium]